MIANTRVLPPARFVLMFGHAERPVRSLSERVIACAITVHRTLGPGLPESIYRECVALELVAADMHVDSECHLPVIYRGERVAGHLVLDLVVDQSLLIEVKAVERLAPVHVAQVITYLKITGYPVGLLMNFNATTLRAGLRRCEHPDIFVAAEQRLIRTLDTSSEEDENRN
jgi:GxxExxY protein